MPVFWAIQHGAWLSAVLFVLLWVLVFVVTVTPVRGRSATGWLAASIAFVIGGLAGWTRFASRASTGMADELGEADLPGVLQGVQIHDGPPQGHALTRVAIIQDHGAKTWAVTAAVVHPGIGLSAAPERHRQGSGLSELLDLASRTELIDEILFTVRTVPEDGAERDLWMSRHQRSNGPALSRKVNDELKAGLARASVRTEAFVTIVIPENRIGREAKECGGGLAGRARVLYGLMGEVEAQLRGAMAMTAVTWLTSPQLGLDLAHEPVQDPGTARQSAAAFLGLTPNPVLWYDDRHERLGADRGARQSRLELVVDLSGQRRPVRALVAAHPQVPLGPVLGHGADGEQDLVDELGP